MFRPHSDAAPFLARALCLLVIVLACLPVWASAQQGQITFNGLPVPGAIITATQGDKKFVAVSDMRGLYSIPDLADGTWDIQVEMSGFATAKQQIAVAPNATPAKWELKLLSLDDMHAEVRKPSAVPAPTPTVTTATAAPKAATPAAPGAQQQQPKPPGQTAQAPEDEDSQRAADGLLINGSSNNGASSPFAQAAAFGNNRFGGRSLYNGGIGFFLDNSALDARPFSLSGQSASKADYNRMTGVINFGGPLPLPHVKLRPMFFVGYQWTRNSNATTLSGLVPTLDQRKGVFTSPIINPATGLPFANNTIATISPQALALLNFYPQANVTGNARYNYQIPVLSPTHQDALQMRMNKTVGRSNQFFGAFSLQSVRASNPNLFGFVDSVSSLGLNTNVNWLHRFNNNWFVTAGYQFSRFAEHVTPFFENRTNVSGQAGITGNNQDPANWGPPALTFSSGIAGLSDAQSAFNRNQTNAVSISTMWNHGKHNVMFGGDFRRREFNFLSQQDPRGTFTFTGAASGSDFADFLLGTPSALSIAYGNADKYFRESLYDGFLVDDFRVNGALTVNAGVRWEYGAPITELRNRLVDLDVAPGFTAAAPVLASNPVGSVTANHYPNSLVRPDKSGFQPRIGIAWKPVPGSSMVVRAGYGIYEDTSVYQTIASAMAQQPPLSKTLSLQNSASTPLTMASGFAAPASAARNTYAVDPNFRIGYAQNWQLSVQHNLPAALQFTATYIGIKGTHAVQALLPNTVPVGATNTCPSCPLGFVYLSSGGNSTRQAGQLQLRRRLRSGFAGTLTYTYSKSLDDAAALGGGGAAGNSPNVAQTSSSSTPPGVANLAIAQDWRNVRADRGLSSFDQRHVLSAQTQYTTGMGLHGGGLLGGKTGVLLTGWTISSTISAATGLPQTPVYLVPVTGTAFVGTVRPDYTGASIDSAPAGLFLNPAAFTAPARGQWGDARRGSITGPGQFSLNGSLARSFKVKDRYTLDLRVDSTNALNHVAYRSWNTTINSAQFGLPVAANGMRTLQTSLRLRF